MVTMAQSAANWRNTHTHMDRTHSLTHTCINTVATVLCEALAQLLHIVCLYFTYFFTIISVDFFHGKFRPLFSLRKASCHSQVSEPDNSFLTHSVQLLELKFWGPTATAVNVIVILQTDSVLGCASLNQNTQEVKNKRFLISTRPSLKTLSAIGTLISSFSSTRQNNVPHALV